MDFRLDPVLNEERNGKDYFRFVPGAEMFSSPLNVSLYIEARWGFVGSSSLIPGCGGSGTMEGGGYYVTNTLFSLLVGRSIGQSSHGFDSVVLQDRQYLHLLPIRL